MSNPGAGHLQDDDLLRLLDGELSDGSASLLRSHMEACWTCRTRLEELETTIGEYVRYRETALIPLLPPPPQAWNDLQPKFEELDRSLSRPRSSLAVKRTRRFGLPIGLRPAPWLAAAACLVGVFIVIWRFGRIPAVSASELLRKATAAQAAFSPPLRIRITTRGRTFTRPAVTSSNSKLEAANVELRQMFDSAHFSWEDPLSARSFAAWHDRLAEKNDRVEQTADAYVIKTTTSASDLHQATLTLRANDLRPVREMLQFTSDTVEIADVPPGQDTPTVEPAPASETTKSRDLSPVTAPTIAIPPAHRLLQVFSGLHHIAADLGEPVEIKQTSSGLSVVGTGLTTGRQAQLRAALAEVPGVEVVFEDARASAPADTMPTGRGAPATAPMQLRLQALLGSRESAEDFTNRALDASDAVMARVHALRALARAFSPTLESSLSQSDRDALTTLRNDHAAALSQRIGDLQRTLQPVLPSDTTPGSPAEPAATWQTAAQSLFGAAQQLDQSLNTALAGPAPSGSDSDFRKLALALGRLQSHFAILEKASQ